MTNSRRSGEGTTPDLKDFVAFPLRGRSAVAQRTQANLAANIIRNCGQTIIFCGHFPDQAETFTEEEVETRDPRWLATCGSCSGRQHRGRSDLSPPDRAPLYQVEHHLFPAIPNKRYAEIAPQVKEICEHYELPYNTGRSGKQWGIGAAFDHPTRVPGW